MRLSHLLVESPFFVFHSAEELILALEDCISSIPNEENEIKRLTSLALPPISSVSALATMLGLNPGFIWSMINRPHIHYRCFSLKTGKKEREILAPKVGLKIFQHWFAKQVQKAVRFEPHVYGFVPGRSHIDAAAVHCNANWVHSFDIDNFFPSTPDFLVGKAIEDLGYNAESTKLLVSLLCYRGVLPQGAPSSPVLSNLVFREFDGELKNLAIQNSINVTRYADDIVFSGKSPPPNDLEKCVREIFDQTNWTLSEEKIEFSETPDRLKVHGLLVDKSKPRLTKGYRNKIRAYRHILATKKLTKEDELRLLGHSNFAASVENFN